MADNGFVSVAEFEAHAQVLLPRNARDYYKSGAGDEQTLRDNRDAFKRIRIRPRFLKDVSVRKLDQTIFGASVQTPIGIAPTAMQKMAHPDGECASAIAAGEMGTVFILSTISTSSIEEVARAAPDTTKWFQLYIYVDRDLTRSLVRRAEKNGYKALVLTIDTPMFGLRRADTKNKFSLPPHLKLANFTGETATDINTATKGSGLNEYVTNRFDTSLTWDDVRWLISLTKLPVLVKGVLTKQDAVLAVDYGIKGIIVSNHGARQMDGTPASIEALPEIAEAVGTRAPVFMDGGVTQGTDVLKALALGAKMVFIGRPVLWGLACGGKDGVKDVLQIIKHELDTAMAISGCRSLGDITKDLVVHESYYSRL